MALLQLKSFARARIQKNKEIKRATIEEYLREEEDFDLDYFGDEFWDEDLDDDDDEVVTVSPEIAEKVAKYHEAAECLLEELENGTYGI